ncbi:MAG: peptidoglycan recognition family protein [Planctomycetota bacterium]|nr:peptidoglycan recognition family protein [Planctomycetota bacterium]
MNLDRRSVVSGGLLLGASWFLAGCQSAPKVSSSSMPGPVWPDEEHGPAIAGPVGPPPSNYTPPITPGPIAPPPGVIARGQWTNEQPRRQRDLYAMGKVTRITVHHDALNSSGLRTMSDSQNRLRSIRSGHLKEGWADIGYHYIIDPSGRIWEGRPIVYQGAHVKENNEQNIGVMLMGNFDQQGPSSNARSSLNGFLAQLMKRHNVSVSRVYTHQELRPTRCPGRNLQSHMLAVRSRGGALTYA